MWQKAALFASNDSKPLEAAVTFISEQVDAATDTVLVRLSLPKDSGLRLGEFINANLFTEEHANCLAVPVQSVVKDEEAGTVIALVEGEQARRTAVKTGLHEGDLIEVIGEGLKEGLNVVTVGAYGLPKETKVRVITPETK
jgi:multidrug efflux pump subunit AcrA (membrane-fusion protein)